MDHHQHNDAVEQAEACLSDLPIVVPMVDLSQYWPIKDLLCIFKLNTVVPDVALVLFFILHKTHSVVSYCLLAGGLQIKGCSDDIMHDCTYIGK